MNYKAFSNPDGIGWGVEDDCGCSLYDADMTKATATRLAEISTDHPELDWEGARQILEAEGFDLRVVEAAPDVAKSEARKAGRKNP